MTKTGGSKALSFWKSAAGKVYNFRQSKRKLRVRKGKNKGVRTIKEG